MKYSRVVVGLLVSISECLAGSMGRIPPAFAQTSRQNGNKGGFDIRVPGFHAHFGSNEILFGASKARVRITFPNSNPAVVPQGMQKLDGRVNYFLGDGRNWNTDLSLFQSIQYTGLYPGIDLAYLTAGGVLKSEFYVQPGTDPARISMQFETQDDVTISENGALIIKTSHGTFEEQAPVSYQTEGTGKVIVGSHFALKARNVVGIEVDDYDRGKLLIIDPVLSFSTFAGGYGGDAITSVAIAADNTIFVAGFTEAADFPTSVPRQAVSGGGVDGFIMHLSSNGSTILYSTYLGGRGDDRITSIKVDAAGRAFVAGCTTSANFPTVSPRQSALSGNKDAFVAGLSANGQALVFSTYFGGSGAECANGLALDGLGGVLIAGETTSANFPVLSPYQATSAGGAEGFFAKFTDAGVLTFSSYLGGNADDRILGIALDSSRNIYLTGSTMSPTFPLMTPMQGALSGGMDAFVTKVNASGSALMYSTYLGGSAGSSSLPEAGYAITVGPAGNAYVAGVTYSANFPTASPSQAVYGGLGDGFVAKLNSSGTGLDLSTFVGGSGQDMLLGIVVDTDGGYQVIGSTQSSNLAVANAIQASSGGSTDVLFGQFTAAGALRSLSYFGGSATDAGFAIAANASAETFFAGQTASSNLPLRNPLQSFSVGSSSAFLVKLIPAPNLLSVTPQSSSGARKTFTFVASASPSAASIATVGLLAGTNPSAPGSCYLVYNQPQNTISLAADDGSTFPSAIIGSNSVLSNSQCNVSAAQVSIAVNGQNLSITAAINFRPSFDGPKTLYMVGIGTNGAATSLQAMGTFQVVATLAPPTTAVSPSPLSGFNRSVQFTFNDINGTSDLSHALIVINSTLAANTSCYFAYHNAFNLLALVNDAGTGWTYLDLSQAGTLQNSQCRLQTGVNAMVATDTAVVLTLQITFAANSVGLKNIYLNAVGSTGLSSGYRTAGTWLVQNNAPTVAATPASPTGLSQSLQFIFSDAGGASDISYGQIVINSVLAGNNSCYVVFHKTLNLLALANDAGTGWTYLNFAQNGTLQNSQCQVQAAVNAVTSTDTSTTLTLQITFAPGTSGSKNIYLDAVSLSGLPSGYRTVGTWLVN